MLLCIISLEIANNVFAFKKKGSIKMQNNKSFNADITNKNNKNNTQNKTKNNAQNNTAENCKDTTKNCKNSK